MKVEIIQTYKTPEFEKIQTYRPSGMGKNYYENDL